MTLVVEETVLTVEIQTLKMQDTQALEHNFFLESNVHRKYKKIN